MLRFRRKRTSVGQICNHPAKYFLKEATMSKFFRPRSFAMIILALIIAAAVYGFAAANTVDPSYVGDGNTDISGFSITNISYDLNNSTPTQVDSVSFTISPDPVEYFVSLDGGTSWLSTCSFSSPTVTCTLSGITALGATNLRVVAAQ